MRVLFLIEHDRPERGNYRLLNPFMRKLRKHCDLKEIVLPALQDKIKKGYTANDLYKDYKPDVTIVYGNFVSLINTSWFKELKGAKVIVIVDFHAHISNNPDIMDRYKQNKFDLIIMRGAYDKNYKTPIPMIWIPFSADEEVFYPGLKVINKIGFAGTISPSVYTTRKKAIKILTKVGLLKRCDKNTCNKGNKKNNKGYPIFLRSIIAGLTSTELYDWPSTPRAKTFEIIGSGTVLLSTYFLGMEEMLGEDGIHYVKYKEDCSDIVSKAKEIIKNPERTSFIAKNGLEVFLKKHTDSIRIKEFYDHLVRLVEGKPIERNYEWEVKEITK